MEFVLRIAQQICYALHPLKAWFIGHPPYSLKTWESVEDGLKQFLIFILIDIHSHKDLILFCIG